MITFIGPAEESERLRLRLDATLQGSLETAVSLAGDSLTETTEGAGEAANYLPENRAVRKTQK